MPDTLLNTPPPAIDTNKIMPGDEGYEAFIEGVAKQLDDQKKEAENASNPPTPVPDYVPAKFRNSADPMAEMAKAYAELEAKLGSTGKLAPVPGAKAEDPKGDATPPATPPAADDTKAPAIPALDDSRTIAKVAGLDFDELYATYVAQGDLTEEQFVKLESAGYKREFIKSHAAGVQALEREAQREVLQSIGGEAAYAEISKWATENLSVQEINEINASLENPNRTVQKLALTNLKMRFDAGAPAKLLTGVPAQQSGAGDVFESEAQVIAAMSDQRYHEDPAYRKAVTDKLSRSKNVF